MGTSQLCNSNLWCAAAGCRALPPRRHDRGERCRERRRTDSLCTLRAGSRSSPAVHDALSTGMSASKSRQNSLSVPRWSVGCHACRPSAACASRSASTTRRRLTAPSTESHSRSSEATIAPLRRLPPKAIAVTAPSSQSHSRYGAFHRGHDRTDTAPSSESHSRSSEATIAPLCRGSCQR